MNSAELFGLARKIAEELRSRQTKINELRQACELLDEVAKIGFAYGMCELQYACETCGDFIEQATALHEDLGDEVEFNLEEDETLATHPIPDSLKADIGPTFAAQMAICLTVLVHGTKTGAEEAQKVFIHRIVECAAAKMRSGLTIHKALEYCLPLIHAHTGKRPPTGLVEEALRATADRGHGSKYVPLGRLFRNLGLANSDEPTATKDLLRAARKRRRNDRSTKGVSRFPLPARRP